MFDVEEAASGEEALDLIQASDFDLVLIDEVMPTMSGMEAFIEIKKLKPHIRVIMMTDFPTIDDAVAAIKKGASNYLSKPLQMDKLLVSIRRTLDEFKFENSTLTDDLDVTFGSLSHQIRRDIMSLLRQNNKMHLMEMVRSLGIEDHTKVIFHTKTLKESGLISQKQDKSYYLTKDGEQVMKCLTSINNHFFQYRT
jgi:DNA-binding response OmpR family regulator